MQPPPFTTAAGLLRFLRGNMNRGKDTMLISEGPEGSGKSTTSANLCMALNPKFDLVSDTIMTFRELLEVLAEGRKRRIYDLDEAINILHNQDWATWQAKALTKVIRQMRIMRCIWVLNVPDFEGLHPYIRDYRARIRLYHEPVFDEDGMGNGPAKMLWKQERFDYKEQRVKTHWTDVGDLLSTCLDDQPFMQPYEAKKEDNFNGLVRDIIARLDTEDAKAKPRRVDEEAKTNPRRVARSKTSTPPTTT